jgi:hypothetical protein
MLEAGYAAPSLAPRANKLAYIILDHLLSTTDPNSRTADEIRFLMSERENLSNNPS